jgi:hypothetical protein
MEDAFSEARRQVLEPHFPSSPEAIIAIVEKDGYKVSIDDASLFFLCACYPSGCTFLYELVFGSYSTADSSLSCLSICGKYLKRYSTSSLMFGRPKLNRIIPYLSVSTCMTRLYYQRCRPYKTNKYTLSLFLFINYYNYYAWKHSYGD